MGCTPCKEDPNYDANMVAPRKGITTLDGIKRQGSPGQSFAEPAKDKKIRSDITFGQDKTPHGKTEDDEDGTPNI